ncbi:MAG: DUF2384 domain-containing protein [Chroococcidiopsidaceae cyanobacterium CP_BM_ER_R8_30]|nr:DUF2384 domain-containing protein [Chroococcidiopsidaceae cyanobacterium CP_BM_ER_R8_30]
MTSATEISALRLLGISLPLDQPPPFGVIHVVRKGLSTKSAVELSRRFEIQESQMSQILGLSSRTFSRNKMNQTILDAAKSDRLFRLAKVLARATDVLEDEATARDWLNLPNRALGNARPLDLLDTDAGVEQVLTILGRIEYGVYS